MKTNLVIQMILRILIGVVFIISGSSKLVTHTQFIEFVIGIDILPEQIGTIYAFIVPWIEFVVGSYLIFGIFLRLSLFTIILLGMTFLIANVHEILHGNQYCGHCFGAMVSMPIWISTLLDCVIIFIALYLLLSIIHDRKGYCLVNWLIDHYWKTT
jgi:uncharacterized membrane protein YphA (DoxX/SURF4 family)